MCHTSKTWSTQELAVRAPLWYGARRRGQLAKWTSDKKHSDLMQARAWFSRGLAALIAAAQAVEHYEITRYGSLIAWAKELGRNDCATLLQQNLDEEKAADKKLTAMAESKVNRKAA